MATKKFEITQLNIFESNMKTRRTYLRYPGGKSKSVKRMERFIPRHFDEYRETMVGGGSMFLHLVAKYPDKRFWINDIYENLYLFWTVCRDHNKHLVNALLKIKAETSKESSAEYFVNFRDTINAQDALMRAAYFYYLNKCSFSGLTESGTCSPQAWVQNFSEASIRSLADLEYILRRVTITNLDYKDVLDTDGRNVFIYLDPPYDIGQANHIYGKNGKHHSDFDHERFAVDFAACQHSAMASYNDSETLRKRFSAFQVHTLDFVYTMRQGKADGGCKTKKELLICNYANTR